MNRIQLSLRAADDPRTLREEDGVPTFASVFSLHNAAKRGRADAEALPITVKASRELAQTLAAELRRGVAFVVSGQLDYYRNPETSRTSYSIWADTFTDITQPKETEPETNQL